MTPAPAFAWLCDALAHDGRPQRRQRLLTYLAGTPEKPIPDWPALVRLAGEQGVTPALASALQRLELLDRLPADLADYLRSVAALNRRRNARLLAELLELARRLNALDVVPLPLKGAANLLAGLYADPAERFMVDLDLLVPADRLAACQAALCAAGWVAVGHAGMTEHHATALARPGDLASVELHGAPLDLPWRAILDGPEMLLAAVPLEREGARLALPAAAHRLVHALAHGSLSDRAAALGRLSLRDLDDAARLAAVPGTLAAAGLAERFAAAGQSAALGFAAGAARLLLGAPLPVFPGGERQLRRALRLTGRPRAAAARRRLLRPWLLLGRALRHAPLRRRLLHALAEPAWYRRQWRNLLGR